MLLSCRRKCDIHENIKETNNISKKMLKSQMIRNRKSIEYKSSNTKYIYDTLLSLDDDKIEELSNQLRTHNHSYYVLSESTISSNVSVKGLSYS